MVLPGPAVVRTAVMSDLLVAVAMYGEYVTEPTNQDVWSPLILRDRVFKVNCWTDY